MVRWSRRQVVQGMGVAGLALLAGCGRLPGQAQAPERAARIGLLAGPPPVYREALLQGLRDIGYTEGQHFVVENRAVDASDERLPEVARELTRLPVDVIVVANTAAAQAAQRATSTIPIVFIRLSDPVGTGLVASLARPGGNATGLSDLGAALASKRLELLIETVAGTTRLAVLINPADPASNREWAETEAAVRALAIEPLLLESRSASELENALNTAVREHADALLMVASGVVERELARVADFTTKARLPTAYGDKRYAEQGGLMAYGPNQAQIFRRAAYYVDRILKGAKPADLPVEQPREFDFVINLKTAQALGLTIPDRVLLQATELIQ